MRVALDTSIIVAASVLGHRDGERAAVWLDAARRGDIAAAVSAHALAETWATLTALPVEPRVPAATARTLLGRLREHVEVLELGEADYDAAMERCAASGLRSDAIYDALHLLAAERWGADRLLTFNTRDFVRLSAVGGPAILAPPDPPGVPPLAP